ncbi:hypothetical protein [Streptomyces sp. WAC 04229]|uniref:hypothetical protein n=1 Tax=Streptomyces sp. WAC 04229 TaxID=2203206 RepID=UPI003D738829
MSGTYDALLEVVDFTNETGVPRWRWRLTPGQRGAMPVESDVDLATDSGRAEAHSYYGFLKDPHGYMLHMARDKAGEINEWQRLQTWLRTNVFTKRIWEALPGADPCVVLLRLDPHSHAREILRYPLGLAAEDGTSGPRRRLVFVHDVGTDASAEHRRTDAGQAGADLPLHLIGVFNRSNTGEPLDLHAEQFRVFDTVGDAAAAGPQGMDITMQALSYHVTHGQLKDLVCNNKIPGRNPPHLESWQIVLYLAGRGAPGSWSAPDASGNRTALSAESLIKMLSDPGNGERLRLVVITTRPASGPSLADQLEDFGIASHRTPDSPVPTDDGEGDALPVELARRLGCAVLAFRHPIGDRVAVALVDEVFRQLLRHGLTLPRALGAALGGDSLGLTSLDAAAPALYGTAACGLQVTPQAAPSQAGPLRRWQPQPSLIGHHAPMWEASKIFGLLTNDRVNGAVLYGMAGAGKTTCARELISQYGDKYRDILVYPPRDSLMPDDPDDALEGFIGALLEHDGLSTAVTRRAPRVPLAERLRPLLSDDKAFGLLLEDIEDNLTRIDSQYVWVVLRDVDKLIAHQPHGPRTAVGEEPGAAVTDPWLGKRLSDLIRALTVPEAGRFRLLITSPEPLRLPGNRMPDIPVPLLSPAEAFLYAQSRKHLGSLIEGAGTSARGNDEAKRLVRRVLFRAGGHSGLLRLADQEASCPDGETRLRKLTGPGVSMDGEEVPKEWQRIEDWATTSIDRFGDPADPCRLLLVVLTRLQPADRMLELDDRETTCLLATVWAGLRRHRSSAASEETAATGPDESVPANEDLGELTRLLQTLADEALITAVKARDGGGRTEIRLHPAVAAVADRCGEGTLSDGVDPRTETDRIAAGVKKGRVEQALGFRSHGIRTDVRWYIAEAWPYLERTEDWDALLHYAAVLLARSRRVTGLADMVRRLRRVLGKMPQERIEQRELAERLINVYEELDDRGRPGLSALLGEARGDDPVDGSRLARDMGVAVIAGLRDTGRLALADEVGKGYRVAEGGRTGPVAAAVDVELIRVLVDRGELAEALQRTESAFESLADVRFRVDDHAPRGRSPRADEAAPPRWSGGAVLRRELFALRRDIRVLMAEESRDEETRARVLGLAAADHRRLGSSLHRFGSTGQDHLLHSVEGVLLGVDPLLADSDGDLDQCWAGLLELRPQIKRYGDHVLLAMTDLARARIERTRAGRARTVGHEETAHLMMQGARDYELAGLKGLYAHGGTPMDIGICHRRIADDQGECRSEAIGRSTPVHQMYAALLGRLTGAAALSPREGDTALWRQEEGIPATWQELCARVREAVAGALGGSVPAVEPERVLRRLVDPQVDTEEVLERAFRDIWPGSASPGERAADVKGVE